MQLGRVNDFKIGIHSFSASPSVIKRQFGGQAGKFTCCAIVKGKGTKQDFPVLDGNSQASL